MSSPTCPSPIVVSIMPSPLVKQTDHCYSKNVTSTPKPKSAPVALQSSTVNAPVTNEGADENITVRVPSLSKTEKAHLASLLHAGGYISHIGDLLLKNKDFLTKNFKTESEEKMKILNKEKHGFVSVLMKKTCDNMYGFSWGQICEEFKSQFPLLASIVEGVMSSGEKNRDKILPRMGMVYAVCAQTRHHKLSLVQRMMTLCLLDNIADQKIYDRLQPVGVCLSYEQSQHLLYEVGQSYTQQLAAAINEGKRLRIVGDNVNYAVGIRDQRSQDNGKTQHLHHAFSSIALIHDVDFAHLSSERPQKLWTDVNVQDLLMKTIKH